MAAQQQQQHYQNYISQFAHPGYSIYVSNLDPIMPEPLFHWILQAFFPGQVVACKFFEEVGTGEPHCFVMFTHPCVASAALNILNGRTIYGKKIRVNWACPPTAQRQQTVTETEGSAVYVGDLSPDIDDKTLYEVFGTFGQLQSATVYRDPETGHSKGFGFVVYRNQTDAEKAIERMNGNMLGARPIKVSWATRNKSGQMPTPLNYMEVYSQAPESHTTVYVGGLPSGMDDLGCRLHFEQFGKLQDVNYFPDKRYAFVRFETHEGAATAIVRTNGQTLDGSTLKCWWSKDNTTAGMPGQSAIVPFSQPPMGQPGPMYYQ